MSSSPVDYSITPPRDAFRDRHPPYSEEAETAVLAAMLMDQDAILRAVEHVDDTMFYREANRRIFRAMVAISERGEVVDPLTLANELARRGELEASGGKDYIGFLVDVVPTAANVEYHARIVREKALLRRLIEASTSIVQSAFEGKTTAEMLLDEAEAKIFQVSQQRGGEGFTRIKELLWPTMERIEALQRGGQTVTGVPTGFADLDELTSGFQPADLIIIAARPSMGKTAFTLNIAQHASIEAQVPVAFFSLEMSKESLVQRMLTSEARVDAQRLRKGLLRDDDFPRLSRGLKSLAKELNVPVVALSQLSRAPEQRAGEDKGRPQLSDLRESGAIEQDADLILFLYRPEVYFGAQDKDGNSLEGKAEIIIGKQRNGPIGSVNAF